MARWVCTGLVHPTNNFPHFSFLNSYILYSYCQRCNLNLQVKTHEKLKLEARIIMTPWPVCQITARGILWRVRKLWSFNFMQSTATAASNQKPKNGESWPHYITSHKEKTRRERKKIKLPLFIAAWMFPTCDAEFHGTLQCNWWFCLAGRVHGLPNAGYDIIKF